ncbi:FAD-binding protein [Nanoarchaeota archaeon]
MGLVIIGSGIAGSSLAYELEKTNLKYFICTDKNNSLMNTSRYSYGHFRLATNLEELVDRSVSQLGEDREKMEFIYSQTNLIPKFLDEINIEYEKRSFGIIPVKQRGGIKILKKLQKNLKINTGTELIDFKKNNNNMFDIYLKNRNNNEIFRIQSKYLVLATGGYSGKYENTDNVKYNSYNIFDLVKKNNGKIINTHCKFIHPFGYNGGKKILIGKQAKSGEFVDKDGNYVFKKKQREMIKNDNYHEIFDQLIKQADECRQKGSDVYFISSNEDLNLNKKNSEKNEIDKKTIITPCIHYTSGGIKTDYLGRVKGIENLFAIGECQANGSRNNGRFPGYPFTSSIVYAKKLGEYFI